MRSACENCIIKCNQYAINLCRVGVIALTIADIYPTAIDTDELLEIYDEEDFEE